MKKTKWKPFFEELPPISGTDYENAYISKEVIIRDVSRENIKKYLSIGILFISWDGEIELNIGNWGEKYTVTPDQDSFEHYEWREVNETS